MKSSALLVALSTCVAIASAQNPVFVTAAGAPFPGGAVSFPIQPPTTYALPLALATDAKVYVQLDPSWPTGYYFVDVADVNFVSISQLAPEDRVFYAANNGNAGFAISRATNTPGLPGPGVGLNGVGQSVPLFPFSSALPIAGRTDLNCVAQVYISSLGASPTGAPTFLCTSHFRVGNGSPGSVTGVVFEDLNLNGVRDPGEPGVASAPIKLVTHGSTNAGQVVASVMTNTSGAYTFASVAIDDCSVVLDINSPAYIGTTPTDVRISACGCGNQVVNFGKRANVVPSVGRTAAYWFSNPGVAVIQNGGYWDELCALNLVNGFGGSFNPTGSVLIWRLWLLAANNYNMAYPLSVQLAAMRLNVACGAVSPNSYVQTPQGPMTVGALMTAANAALALDSWTPLGDANRALQLLLKNALDAANHNLNWL